MYENLRSDLRDTSLGARIEGEMSRLWDAAELFSVSANYPPPDLAGLNRTRAMLADVNVAFRQVDSSLGPISGSSPVAAIHLQDIARLLPVMNALFEAVDAEAARPILRSRRPRGGTRGVRDQSRGLAEDLGGYIAELNKAIPVPADRDALIADANGLVLDLLQGFDRTLVADPSNRDLVDSLRLVKLRMWSVEAVPFESMGHRPCTGDGDRSGNGSMPSRTGSDSPRDRARPCRRAGPGCRPHAGGPGGSSGRRAGRVPVRVGCRPEGTEEGSAFEALVGRLRLGLLQFRQRVLAKEPVGQLASMLREIEAVNQQLIGRARPDGRITRGTSTLKAPGFQAPSQAVSRLSDPASRP